MSHGLDPWAVTYEDDPGRLHERLMLRVIKPDRFVVLTLDGDLYDEMLDSWRTAQIMTGRQRYPDGPTDVVAFCRTDGGQRVAPSHHRWSTRGGEDQCCRVPHSRCGACCEALTTPGVYARVSHRLRGRRATFREETLFLVDTADEVREEDPR